MMASARPALLALLLAVGGCAALDDEIARREPAVSVESARLGAVTFDSAEIVANVAIDNPNPVAIEVAGYAYDLSLEDRRLLEGERDADQRIAANDRSTVEVPLEFAFADVRDIARDLGSRDEVDYALALDLGIDVPVLGRRDMPVETSGSLPVPRLPTISLERLRVDELGWQRGQATLELAVVNPNGFGLDLDGLDYSLAIDGERWISGDAAVDSSVPARGAGRIDIPVELDFATIGRGAYRLLSGSGDLDYSLEGRLDGVAGDDRLGRFDLEFSRAGEAGVQR